MKKNLCLLLAVMFITTGCSSSPENLGEVQNLEPIDTEIVEATYGEYEQAYKDGEYSIDNPFIGVDVYGHNPLSAYVVFPIDEAATYSYTVVGKDENTNFTQTSEDEQTDTLVIPIIGLYSGYDNTVEITVDYTNGGYDQFAVTIPTQEIVEAPIPDGNMTSIDVDYSDSSVEEATKSLEGGFIMTSIGDAYDVNGDIRIAGYYRKGVGSASPTRINEDGSYLQFIDQKLYHIDMTGKVINQYVMPEDLYPHHDAMIASNGYVYSLATPNYSYEESQANDTYNDGLIVVWEEGKPETPFLTVDLSKEFEGNLVNDSSTNQAPGTDLLHLNSITYDEGTDTIIVSSQSENMLIGLDPMDLSVRWTTADEEVGTAHEDLKLEWLDGHVHSNGQHNVQVTNNPAYDDGNDDTIEFIMFSNYYCVGEDNKSIYNELNPGLTYGSCGTPTQSDILVYRVDTKNMTVETLEQHGYDGYYSLSMSGYAESDNYDYNYISYANRGTLIIADSEFNRIAEVQLPEDIAGKLFYGSYRMNVTSKADLEAVAHNSFENGEY